MPRTARTIGFSVPPELADEVERLAAEEGRTKSELFREMVRVYRRMRDISVSEPPVAYGAASAASIVATDERRFFDPAALLTPRVTLGDLSTVLAGLPHLGHDDAGSFGEDVAAAREQFVTGEVVDPWRS